MAASCFGPWPCTVCSGRHLQCGPAAALLGFAALAPLCQLPGIPSASERFHHIYNQFFPEAQASLIVRNIGHFVIGSDAGVQVCLPDVTIGRPSSCCNEREMCVYIGGRVGVRARRWRPAQGAHGAGGAAVGGRGACAAAAPGLTVPHRAL